MNLFYRKSINAEKVLLFLVALAAVYANGSWMHFDHKIVIKTGLILFLGLYVMLKGKNKRLTNLNFLVVFLLAFPLISTYLINFSPQVNVANIINTSVLLILFSLLAKDDLYTILEKYCRAIYVLMLISIPLGLCSFFFLEIFEKAPRIHSSFFDANGGYWYNLVVFTERSIQDFRVQSIFWEPGAWAYNQMIAFFYLVYVKHEHKKVPIFLISILLTLSTSGILALLICIVPLLRKFNRRYVVIISTAFGIIIAVMWYLMYSNEILAQLVYQNTIGKFASDSISFEDRYSATANAFQIANDNWFFGIGRLDSDSFVYVTSCISEIAYQLGYFYLVVYFITFLQPFKKLGLLLAVPFCLVLMNSEAYAFYPLNILIIALGSKLVLQKKINRVNALELVPSV